MLPCVDAEADNGLLAQRLGGFQPVQALDQDEARAIGTHQDGRLLAIRDMLCAISSTRFGSRVVRRLMGT